MTHQTRVRVGGAIALVCYIATIIAANWAVNQGWKVPVGFGLIAPAGVYFAGLAFTFRDLTQDRLGRDATMAAIAVGACLSYLTGGGRVAAASAAAFLVSEAADLAVYTPLRERGRLRAVLASNTVGLLIDSVLFLQIAFGSLDQLPGQVVGKAWMTLAAVAVLAVARRYAAHHRGRHRDPNAVPA